MTLFSIKFNKDRGRYKIEMHFSKTLIGKVVLITGATGMIGSQLVKKLAKESDVKIIALYRNENKKNEVFTDLVGDNIEWICCDVTKFFNITSPVDYIIHTAGVTGGSKQHVDFPMRTIATAIDGTRNMLEIARKKKVLGFVFLSSLEVYGTTDYAIHSIQEDEGGYVNPISVRSSYSESKRLCETMCAAYFKQFCVPAKVVRLAPTYGLGAYYTDNRVLCEFARCIIEGKDIVLRSTGDTVRNYCDVEDAVNAIICVMLKGKAGEAYNIANMETEISIKELAERFIALYPDSGSHIKFDIPKDITTLGYNKTVKIRLDSRKLMTLGWRPQCGTDKMIRHLVDAMRTVMQCNE